MTVSRKSLIAKINQLTGEHHRPSARILTLATAKVLWEEGRSDDAFNEVLGLLCRICLDDSLSITGVDSLERVLNTGLREDIKKLHGLTKG
ncbi:hypothetical protein 2050H1_103 [Serratia phage 2050H1]|uniref:Uncharacterized protein n=1 Tax=Serratia phage 2050H1 TaxID=2024250 RepID=A0A249Y2G9_9CAUD|nr:hypothetical protein 2050H1_103 [Serratia phage 2050H1]